MITRERLVTLGVEIHESLTTEPAALEVNQAKLGIRSQAFVPCVYGLALHCVNSGRAMIDLHETGREVLSLPLARLTLETAITALWLVQTREGLAGFVNEGSRQRKNIFEQMRTSSNAVFREGAQAHMPDEELLPSFTDGDARSFHQRCQALQGGHDVYLYYRLLCDYTHAGARVVDEYLLIDDAREAGITFLTTPQSSPDSPDSAWLFVTVTSMVWGARALDHIEIGHRRRSRLRQIAQELGVPETLKLTPEAHSAYASKAANERRSRWTGRKPRSSKPRDSS